MAETTDGYGTHVEYAGEGVWVAHLDQDAVEDIAHYLVIGARHCTHPRPKIQLAAMFREALDAAFPDGGQDPTPAPNRPSHAGPAS